MGDKRDDIVITPGVEGDEQFTGAKGGHRTHRGVRGGRSKGLSRGAFATARGAAAVSSSKRSRRRAAEAKKAFGSARKVSNLVRNTGGKVISRAGGAVVVAMMAAIVAQRLASGNPIEAVRQKWMDEMWNNAPDDARASMQALTHMQSGDDYMRSITDRKGEVGHLQHIFDHVEGRELMAMRGRAALIRYKDEEGKNVFLADSMIEQLAVRGKNVFLDAFYAAGGFEAIRKLTRGY